MGDLSEHFSIHEFACPCCGAIEMNPRLIELLEIARSRLGRPITIKSGFRCPLHNAAVGGKQSSAHLQGEAADILCEYSGQRYDLIKTLLVMGVERIGVAEAFVHVDVNRTLPGQVLWLYAGGG